MEKNFKEIILMYRAPLGFKTGYLIKEIVYAFLPSDQLHKKIKELLIEYGCCLAEIYHKNEDHTYSFEKIIYLKLK